MTPRTDHEFESYGLLAGFLRSASLHPGRDAVSVGGETATYGRLSEQARTLADLVSRQTAVAAPHVAILSRRSIGMYRSILAALACGGVVVPLNPAFPPERIARMLEIGEVDAVLVDESGAETLAAALPQSARGLVVIGSTVAIERLSAVGPNHRVLAIDDAVASPAPPARPVAQDAFAYIFFTSGSTGLPKAVGVLHRNAVRFVEMSCERYAPIGLGPEDRFSQFYDITFDSSMFDLFVGWAFGACLYGPTAGEWINPNRFIADKALTVIDIVPSTGHTMNRSGSWRPGRFPTLRLCRFGGEALSASLADQLARAAPNAAVDNVYGPTECTVDAAYYRWQGESSLAEAVHGIVPIGVAGPRVGLSVVDADLKPVAIGAEGELLISGPQVTPGYWQDAERTARSFVRLGADGVVHYRTGDLVRRVPEGEPIPYLGRIDQQIKISGVRIELGEIEQALRRASRVDTVVAVGWPRTPSGASGIVAFVAGSALPGAQIRDEVKRVLPAVMVPREVRLLDALPLNVNGKVDRKALVERLDTEAARAASGQH